MEMSDHYMDAWAESGWNNCTDCGKPLDPVDQHITQEGEVLCALCNLYRECEMLAEYEHLALADDDPAGCCASHHRGYISALSRVMKSIKELQ